MLLPRIMTAVFLIVLVLLGIFYLPTPAFITLSTALMLWVAWEWSALLALVQWWQRPLYILIILLSLGVVAQLPTVVVLTLAVLWWLLASCLVITYPDTANWWSHSKGVRAIMGVLSIAPAWFAINHIHQLTHGATVLLFLLLLVWGADTGAYFIGRFWGKQRLLPRVSPGKTVQGFLGGLVVVWLLLLLVALWQGLSWADSLFIIWLGTLVFMASVMGDLFESMLKRVVGIKDSGRLLPGHGGILDRVDSLLAAAPVFLSLLWLWRHLHYTA